MHALEDPVIVGRFGRPHGVKGLIAVHSFTDPVDNILDYQPWFIKKDDVYQPVSMLQLTRQGQKILAMVKGYETREQVNLLTNSDIAVSKAILPELSHDEFYWHDLVGMTVVDHESNELGMVEEVMETGSNDVLVVNGEQRYLIPWLMDETIISVDKKLNKIIVQWDLDF